MYVCLCHAVTESDLAHAISEGADSLKALQTATGAGTGCGSCLGELELWAARARARRFPILGAPSRVAAGDTLPPDGSDGDVGDGERTAA